MTKIPSTLIFHKHADGTDTRFSLMGGDFAENALERWLGVIECGAYVKAEGDPTWAFEPLASMWTDDIPDDADNDHHDHKQDCESSDEDMPPVDADSDDEDGEVQAREDTPQTPTPQPKADSSHLVEPMASDHKAL
jgi:hypothetical protein